MSFTATPQSIYVPSLNYDASNNSDIVYDNVPAMDAYAYDAKATLDVSYSLMNEMFQYKSTTGGGVSFYITDPTASYFGNLTPSESIVDMSFIPTGNTDPSKGLVDGQQSVGVDFIESLAYKMFGSAYYDTFFVNSDALVDNIATDINNTYITTSISHISSISTTGTDTDLSGPDGSKYLSGSDGYPKNIGRILFQTLLRTDPGRFNVENNLVSNTTERQNIPLVVGDKLQFIVTLTPSVNQSDPSNPNPGYFPNGQTVQTLTRKYLIELVLSN